MATKLDVFVDELLLMKTNPVQQSGHTLTVTRRFTVSPETQGAGWE